MVSLAVYLVFTMWYYNFTKLSSRYYCYIRRFITNFPRVFINSHHICAVLAYKVENMVSLAVICINKVLL